MLKMHDIIALQETWLRDKKDDINEKLKSLLSEYTPLLRNRIGKNKKAKKGSGGVLILYKNSLDCHITRIPTGKDGIIWCKLDKTHFGWEKDIYLGNVYIPPDKSTIFATEEHDYWDQLEEQILQFSKKGHIWLLGDLNARPGGKQDFIQGDNDMHIPLPESYEIDDEICRKCEDSGRNAYGPSLLNACIGNGLRILNGRIQPDIPGKFTCHENNGSSTVDYSIVSKYLIPYIKSFEVLSLITGISDHCPISTEISYLASPVNAKDPGLTNGAQRVVWDDTSKEKFTKELNTIESRRCLSQLEEYMSTQNELNVDKITHDLNSILLNAAKSSLHVINPGVKKKRSPRQNKQWFKNCIMLSAKNAFLKDTRNPYLRGNFFRVQK
jgi:exonuclease III